MPPAVAIVSEMTATTSSSPPPVQSSSSSRERAASEDIYFGVNDSSSVPRRVGAAATHRYYEQQDNSSLLGQALQGPSTTSSSHFSPPHQNDVGADEEEDDSHCFYYSSYHDDVDTNNNNNNDDDDGESQSHTTLSSGVHDKLTPPIVKSENSDGDRTPLQHNNLYPNHHNHHHQHSNSHNTFSSSGRSSGSASMSRLHGSISSSTTTRVTDNYQHHHPNNVHFQDPLSLSCRSLQSADWQSDDSHCALSNGNLIVPQSVDTVPTSNVATFQQYQRQQQQFNQQQKSSSQSHQQYPARNGNTSPPTDKVRLCVSPPQQLRFHHPAVVSQQQQQQQSGNAFNNSTSGGSNGNNKNSDSGRRTVFGSRVQKRYPKHSIMAIPTTLPADPAPFYNIIEDGEQITFQQAAEQPPEWDSLSYMAPPSAPQPSLTVSTSAAAASNYGNSHTTITTTTMPDDANKNNCRGADDGSNVPLPMVVTATTPTPTTATPTSSAGSGITPSHNNIVINGDMDGFLSPRNSLAASTLPTMATYPNILSSTTDLVSPLQSPTLMHSPPPQLSHPHHLDKNNINNISGLTCPMSPRQRRSTRGSLRKSSHHKKNNGSSNNNNRQRKIHETVHAQSLLLGLCFMAIWSPNNIMAPNLTQIAKYYDMSENERDLYLGSFLALATGVLSFPLSALIGFMTDLHSRKRLFVGTALGGSIASAATGFSPTYPCLLVARFFSGGFMSASVSVAFSLMGDLFATEERNAASSGLTAMMGMGIILGQVYAGIVGDTKGWQHAFYVSSVVTAFLGICVATWVQEPVRGGKEKVLQDMLRQGKRYDRKLTWNGFWLAMTNNRSNGILMAQGFFSSIPWGIIFVFLNDYLSQERGFSVPDATFIVLVFGVGCAFGGVLGGTIGAKIQSIRRSLLPLFMAATTLLAVLPFYGLLNGNTTNAHGFWAVLYSFLGGCISSMPSVNVRPCLINVNPPETRGASLTAANLIISVARGVGPSFITLLGSTFHMNRQLSFNVTVGAFWAISSIQLCFLAQSLPQDQDQMEAELANYAALALATSTPVSAATAGRDFNFGSPAAAVAFILEPERPESNKSLDDISLVSIEDRMTTFDGTAARESISFIQKGMSELTFPPSNFCAGPNLGNRQDLLIEEDNEESDSSSDDIDNFDDDDDEQRRNDAKNILSLRAEGDDTMSPVDLLKRRNLWIQQQQRLYGSTATEEEKDQQEAGNTQHADDSENTDETHPTENSRLLG